MNSGDPELSIPPATASTRTVSSEPGNRGVAAGSSGGALDGVTSARRASGGTASAAAAASCAACAAASSLTFADRVAFSSSELNLPFDDNSSASHRENPPQVSTMQRTETFLRCAGEARFPRVLNLWWTCVRVSSCATNHTGPLFC